MQTDRKPIWRQVFTMLADADLPWRAGSSSPIIPPTHPMVISDTHYFCFVAPDDLLELQVCLIVERIEDWNHLVTAPNGDQYRPCRFQCSLSYPSTNNECGKLAPFTRLLQRICEIGAVIEDYLAEQKLSVLHATAKELQADAVERDRRHILALVQNHLKKECAYMRVGTSRLLPLLYFDNDPARPVNYLGKIQIYGSPTKTFRVVSNDQHFSLERIK